jgi:GTP-binding protein Era
MARERDTTRARLPIERSGTVAIVGRSNVGKSTLLNAALALPLAIVSDKPQTTRARLLGIVRHAGAEIGLLDTPGLHAPRTRLGHAMNRSARHAIAEADAIAFVVGLPGRREDALRPLEADLAILATVPQAIPTLLVLNKIDRVRPKARLLPLLAAWARVRDFAAIVPTSALRASGVTRVLDEIARLLPEGGARHDEDALTDRPLRWLAAEYVREPILAVTRQEVPHAVAVTVERFEEPVGPSAVHVAATIHVERSGQKPILIGEGGAMLERIGSRARRRIEALVDRKVHLELFVRVTEGWRDDPTLLGELGLGEGGR